MKKSRNKNKLKFRRVKPWYDQSTGIAHNVICEDFVYRKLKVIDRLSTNGCTRGFLLELNDPVTPESFTEKTPIGYIHTPPDEPFYRGVIYYQDPLPVARALMHDYKVESELNHRRQGKYVAKIKPGINPDFSVRYVPYKPPKHKRTRSDNSGKARGDAKRGRS